MSEPIIIALEVYFLGFVIAMAMAAIIKLILFILHRGKKNSGGEGTAPAGDEKGQGDQKDQNDPKKREEGAA
jgi:hypothetical protein